MCSANFMTYMIGYAILKFGAHLLSLICNNEVYLVSFQKKKTLWKGGKYG